MKRLALLAPLLVLTACPAPPGTTDAGVDAGLQAPSVTSITPTSGPLTGGTDVAVFGSNFEDGVKLFFGATEGVAVTRVTKGRITAKTPPASAAGAVDIKVVNADGQEAVLAGVFTYEAPPPKTIANAFVDNNAQATVTTSNTTVQVAVTAVVYVDGVTQGVGAGAGILSQVGFGAPNADPANQGAFTWTDAAYTEDTGPGLENDRYRGNVTLAAPTDANPVSYAVAARFSVDNGQNWVVADRDGSSNGVLNAQLPVVTVAKPKPNWCKLGGTAVGTEITNLRTNQANATIYVQIYHQGVTEAAGAGTGVKAQLGYGAPNSLLDTNGNPVPTAFTWIDATYNTDQGNNDEFKATLANPGAGTYSYAYRVSLNDGPYLYCDADSPDNGLSEAQLGTLNVTPVQIDSCNLQFPAALVATTGAQTAEIFGRVAAQGVTDVTGAPTNFNAELGYGAPTATDPATWTNWTAATFNIDVDATTDEFKARITAPAAGSYRYAYRFRYGTTGAYTYCDLDGSNTAGFSIAKAGKLDVPIFTDCKLIALSSSSATSGQALAFEARVYGATATSGTGANANIKAQVGIGPAGTSADSSTLWGWGNASFVSDITTGTDTGWDQYLIGASPAYVGSRAVAARFSSDNGQSWLYCDLNSYQTGGFQQTQQQALNVTAHTTIDFCNLQFPDTVTQGTMGTGAIVYGRMYEPGVTEAAGAPAGWSAQLGYGPSVEDPGISSAWTWINATWNTQAGTNNNDDEFKATLPSSVQEGNAYAFRFSQAGPATPYCYGDLDGHNASGGFSGERQDGSGNTVPNLGRVVP